MKLGLVAHCYRERVHNAEDPLLEAIQIAGEQGLTVVAAPMRDWRDPRRRDAWNAARLDAGVELEAGWGFDFVRATDDEAAASLDTLAEMLDVLFVPLGVRIVGTCARTHRWLKDPPRAEHLARMAARLRPAAELCAERGVTLALENHADYRGREIAQVIREVDSPGLGARLDTANAIWTFEDPLECAEALAPLAVTTHVKDLKIIPVGRWEGAVLGEGDAQVAAQIALLAEQSPAGADLHLIAEVEAIPEGVDKTEAANRSLELLRQQAARLASSDQEGQL